MPEHHIVTVPGTLAARLRDVILTAVERALHEEGAARIRVDTTVKRDVIVLAELPEDQREAAGRCR